MNLEEYKDIVQLRQLAEDWIKQYETNDLGNHSKQLQRQFIEMKLLLAKTSRLIDQHAGESGGGSEDDQFNTIKELAQGSPAFANCFGPVPNDEDQPIGPDTVAIA